MPEEIQKGFFKLRFGDISLVSLSSKFTHETFNQKTAANKQIKQRTIRKIGEMLLFQNCQINIFMLLSQPQPLEHMTRELKHEL